MRINNINNTCNFSNKNTSNNVSFNGGGLKGIYENLSKNDTFKSTIKKVSKYDTFTHLLVIESTILSGFYMINTWLNKNIDEKQKPQMIINDALTLLLSTLGAYFAEDKISAIVNKKAEEYFSNHKDFYREKGREAEKSGDAKIDKLLKQVEETKSGQNIEKGIDETSKMMGKHLKDLVGKPKKLKTFQVTEEKIEEAQKKISEFIRTSSTAEEAKEKVKKSISGLYEDAAARAQADKIMSGINKLKVLVIFGLIYRFAGPVIITPIANYLSKKFFEK